MRLQKTDVFRTRGPWRGLEPLGIATLECVHWFNHQRIPKEIGNQPAVEAEAANYQEAEHMAFAA